jgi:predicted  nucleic acid-binding Zn-ribbon protein
MSADLDRLIALQQLDTAIEEARRHIAAHPGRLADAEARLAGAREAVEREKARLKENHEARRGLEKDAAVFQSRVTKFKDQLSAVKTNREYQAIQVEIETAQRELGEVEEKVLEQMMEADTIAADIKRAEAALGAQEKEVAAEKTALARALAHEEAKLGKDTEARKELLTQVDPRHLRLFEQVARARKGIAICSATRDGLCSVCHVRLRPQVFQTVRQNDSIVQCDSCQRILYYVPPPGPVDPPVTHPA